MKNKQPFFCKQLKNIMLEKCLTQQGLADKIGVGQQLISFWVTGKQKPNVTSLKKIAAALDVPLNYFFENSDEKNNVQILQLKNEILELKLKFSELEKIVEKLSKNSK